jgi:hypothetical protein
VVRGPYLRAFGYFEKGDASRATIGVWESDIDAAAWGELGCADLIAKYSEHLRFEDKGLIFADKKQCGYGLVNM